MYIYIHPGKTLIYMKINKSFFKKKEVKAVVTNSMSCLERLVNIIWKRVLLDFNGIFLIRQFILVSPSLQVRTVWGIL